MSKIFQKKPIYVPLYVADYLADTAHLTAEQHGCYLLLILNAWRSDDCGLPNDEQKLARLVRMDLRKWRRIAPEIIDMWRVEDGRLYQPRLWAEREAAELKSISAALSSAERWSKPDRERAKSKPQEPDLFANPLKTNETDDAFGYANAKTAKNEGEQKDRGEQRHHFDVAQTPKVLTKSLKTKETGNANGYAKGYANQNHILEEEDEGKKTISPADQLVEIWNDMARANGFRKVAVLTPARRKKSNDRIKDYTLDAISAAISQIPQRPFLCGKGSSGWRADFDWLLRPNSVAKITEGNYASAGKESGWRRPQ